MGINMEAKHKLWPKVLYLQRKVTPETDQTNRVWLYSPIVLNCFFFTSSFPPNKCLPASLSLAQNSPLREVLFVPLQLEVITHISLKTPLLITLRFCSHGGIFLLPKWTLAPQGQNSASCISVDPGTESCKEYMLSNYLAKFLIWKCSNADL